MEYFESYLCEGHFCSGSPWHDPTACSQCQWSSREIVVRHWNSNYSGHFRYPPWLKSGWVIMHWKPRSTIYVILSQRINWAQIGILRNLHKHNFNMHWNIFKIYTSYYIYFNVAISMKLLIYIYVLCCRDVHIIDLNLYFALVMLRLWVTPAHRHSNFKGVPMAMTIGASAHYEHLAACRCASGHMYTW